MLKIDDFAVEYDIKLNTSKSVAIRIGHFDYLVYCMLWKQYHWLLQMYTF